MVVDWEVQKSEVRRFVCEVNGSFVKSQNLNIVGPSKSMGTRGKDL
jgi:hypothetical protein